MKINLNTGKFEEDFNYVLESENPTALSFDNYEGLCDVMVSKTGLVYDDLLYRNACDKALCDYKDNKELFNVEFDVNLYDEYEKIKNNGYKGEVPSKDSNLYKFLEEFDSDMKDDDVEYNDEIFAFSIAGFMFSRVYEMEVEKHVKFLEELKYDFKNENPRLSKSALDEIVKFVIEPWVERTEYKGIVGEEDIEYKLDELVAQSYCKCDYETAMAMYFVSDIVKSEKYENYNDEINSKLAQFKELLEQDENSTEKLYSGETITLAKVLYNMILDFKVNEFIRINR